MKVFHPLYLVWNPGNRNPRGTHPKRPDALTEARRLAKENPGEEFVILESCAIIGDRGDVDDKGSVVLSEDWAE